MLAWNISLHWNQVQFPHLDLKRVDVQRLMLDGKVVPVLTFRDAVLDDAILARYYVPNYDRPTRDIKTIYGSIMWGQEVQPVPNCPGHVQVPRNAVNVAIKRSMKAAMSAHSNERPLHELCVYELLRDAGATLDADHVMEIIFAGESHDAFYAVMPKLSNNNMELFEYTDKHMPERDFRERVRVAKLIFAQILRAVGVMHRCGLAHRDLSLENVLVTFADNAPPSLPLIVDRVAVIDFGMTYRVDLADPKPTKHSPLARSTNLSFPTPITPKRLYISPEGYLELPTSPDKGYGAAVDTYIDPRSTDIWAVGSMLFATLFRAPLFPTLLDVGRIWTYTPDFEMKEYLTGRIHSGYKRHYSEVLEILTFILQLYPERRPSAEEILMHPFFATANADI